MTAEATGGWHQRGTAGCLAAYSGRRTLGALNGHVRGQLQLIQPWPWPDAVSQCPHHQVPVRRSAPISGLEHSSARVLARIDVLTTTLAAFDLRADRVDAGEELLLVVECGHHHVPTLVPFWVVSAAVDDESQHIVVVRVNSCHRPRVSPPNGLDLEEDLGTDDRTGLREGAERE
jgi:hypothetical protein